MEDDRPSIARCLGSLGAAIALGAVLFVAGVLIVTLFLSRTDGAGGDS